MAARAVWRPAWWAWASLGLVALAAAHELTPGRLQGRWLILTPLCVAAGVLALRLLWERPPAATMCAAIVLSVFSGAWRQVGLGGLPLDRLLLLLVLAQVLLRAPGVANNPRLQVRNVHILMCVTAMYAVGSAVAAQTIGTETGILSLVDQFGLMPYAMFLLAPAVFCGEHERNLLLKTLVGLGAYLGLTAIFESLGPHALVFPRYILAGDHRLTGEARAGGPFQADIAEGFATFACSVAAAMAFLRWHGRSARALAAAAAVVSLIGCFLTLERGVWIGALAAAIITALATRSGRRRLAPLALAGVLALGCALALSPSLASTLSSRTSDQSTVWDRQNQISAGLRMVAAKPLLGFGWDRYTTSNLSYFRQAEDYPMVGYSLANYSELGPILPLHETYLSYAVELGLLGGALWLATLLWGVGGAIFSRGPAELRPWKLGLMAIAVCFLAIALFNPYQAPFPVLLLWVWSGVAFGRSPASTPLPTRAAPAVEERLVPA